MILFASSELSKLQRVSKAAFESSVPVTVSTVVIPRPVGLPLVADVSIGVVITAEDLEGVIFMRAMVLFSLFSATEMVLPGRKVVSEVWVLRV